MIQQYYGGLSMGAMSLIPSPDSIPVPWGWFEALLLGTFLCHLLLMNAVLGGGLFLLLGGRSAAPATAPTWRART